MSVWMRACPVIRFLSISRAGPHLGSRLEEEANAGGAGVSQGPRSEETEGQERVAGEHGSACVLV